jgi:Zn-dependent M28 family amino/carboxypeptidase
MVADLNVDMFLTLFPVKDIVVFGGEHSTLGDVIGDVARRLGLEVAPDPFPEEVIFVRSDHYSFVREGIPSIMLSCGLRSADPAVDGGKMFRDWLANVYHSPQDDMSQAIDFASAAKIAEVYLRAAEEIADGPARPAWAKGDFFAARFVH